MSNAGQTNSPMSKYSDLTSELQQSPDMIFVWGGGDFQPKLSVMSRIFVKSSNCTCFIVNKANNYIEQNVVS